MLIPKHPNTDSSNIWGLKSIFHSPYINDLQLHELSNDFSENIMSSPVDGISASSLLLSDNSIQSFRDGVQNFLGGSNGISSLTVLCATLIILSSAVRQVISALQSVNDNQAQRPPSISFLSLFVLRTLPLWIKAILCVVIDVIGDGSFIFPGVGEISDVVWGPVAALLLQAIFGSSIITAATLVKELLPFTDFIPTATLALIVQTFFSATPLGILLGFAPIVTEQQTKQKENEKTNK